MASYNYNQQQDWSQVWQPSPPNQNAQLKSSIHPSPQSPYYNQMGGTSYNQYQIYQQNQQNFYQQPPPPNGLSTNSLPQKQNGSPSTAQFFDKSQIQQNPINQFSNSVFPNGQANVPKPFKNAAKYTKNYSKILLAAQRIEMNLKGTKIFENLSLKPQNFENFSALLSSYSADLSNKNNLREALLLRETIILARKSISGKGSDGVKELESCNIGDEGDEGVLREDVLEYVENIIMDGIFKINSNSSSWQNFSNFGGVSSAKESEMLHIAHKLSLLFELIEEVNDDSIIDLAYSWLQFWFEIQKDYKLRINQVYPYLRKMGNQGGKSYTEFNQTFEDLKDNYRRVIDGENRIKQAQYWEKQLENEQVKLSYRKPDDGTLVMNIQSEVKIANPINLIAVIYEIDMYKRWVPFCKVSQNLGDINKTAKAAMIKSIVKGNF